jgi:ABC-type Fe3+-hydroxamate transport system substrate-binding protein
MEKQELEALVEDLSRGIVTVQLPDIDQREHVAALQHLIATGERRLSLIRDWNGVAPILGQLLGRVEMAKAVLAQHEARRR